MKGNIYHITNRGVEKRKIFLNDEYYIRFINNLRDFNNKNLALMSYHDRNKFNSSARNPNDELVDIVCVCLMPNHYHLLVQEKIDGGASLFSKKISSGFTQYFNLKNKRSGVLFQGKTKIILVSDNAHFLYLPFYIFSNPIKLIESQWKENGVKNHTKAVKFLKNYKWSSFNDTILGDKGYYSAIVNSNLFFEFFDTNKKRFKKDIFEWLENQP